MSDLEELERERGNKEYMEDAKVGVSAVDRQKSEARTASNMGAQIRQQSLHLQLWRRFSVRWWRWYTVKLLIESIGCKTHCYIGLSVQ